VGSGPARCRPSLLHGGLARSRSPKASQRARCRVAVRYNSAFRPTFDRVRE
jgi:hypothetical protein